MTTKYSVRSSLNKAKGLGSAKNGTVHWWGQRITALALIPFIIWFVLSIIYMVTSDLDTARGIINNPLNGMAMILLLSIALYHGYLGMQVIIEDYIHCECMKFSLCILLKFITLGSIVVMIFGILKFYFI